VADDQADGQETGAAGDEFDNLVLDDSFVRGGAYEPPARTREAIARYGDKQTSWRHGGGLGSTPGGPPEARAAGGRRAASARSWRGRRATSPSRSPSTSLSSRLPLIISIAVVAIAAFLMLR